MIAICLLICVGAFAKSAQVPFHTWLPDAMEGPTPVSALIHAATMVTAGVYLIARMFPLFELAPTAADIAAFVGLATLLIAATIALAVTDLKRIIAYSTMSQIGYMIMGVAIGAYAGGMFMLMAHAFFKALLFMAAGSVISAMANNQNIDDMSGFRRAMPFTSALLLVGCLALAAFPGTSGFFSKDEILALRRQPRRDVLDLRDRRLRRGADDRLLRVPDRLPGGRRKPCKEAEELEQGHMHHAPPTNPHTGEAEDTDVGFPGEEHHIAEREWPMRAAMAVLGFGALFAGADPDPRRRPTSSTTFLDGTFESSPLYHLEPSTADSWIGLAIGGPISITGIAIAYYCYVRRPGVTVRLAERLRRTHRSCSTSGTSTRSRTRSSTSRRSRSAASPTRVIERVVVAGDRRAPPPARSRARARSSAGRSRGSCAPTPCCSSAASRRSGSISWW